MVGFLFRRLLGSALVVVLSTAIMYVLVDLAIDPLENLRLSTAPNKAEQIQRLTDELRLDDPIAVRYAEWSRDAAGCLWGDCELGRNWRTNQEVTDSLTGAIANTLKLVTAASVLAIVLGCLVGIVSALRQYTGFDYSMTFVAFLFFSLPVPWVAVLAKAFLAIRFNDFLADPQLPVWLIVLSAGLWGLAVAGALGGSLRRRVTVFGSVAVLVVAICLYLNLTEWFAEPSIGIVFLALLSVGTAVLMTVLSTGLGNRRALGAALTVAGIGVALYTPMLYFWNAVDESWPLIGGLLMLTILVGLVVGYAWGGADRSQSARTAAFTAVPVAALLFIDRTLQSFDNYADSPLIRGRPIATVGSGTPNLDGSFWFGVIDSVTHLLLPTLTLILISFAGYLRYSRASMLEVFSQDYIRTARAKGLTERTVVMRHAFRNALLPLASVVPVDIITLIGGAVLTETVFGWSGMGKLFVDALGGNQLNEVMAYILIVGILAVVANFVADLLYAVLDPRIRVNA
ncbi:MAG: ABC transporter permease [Nocardioides sp.]